jgi:hypothetical protein
MDDTLLNLAIWREDRRLKLKQMPDNDDQPLQEINTITEQESEREVEIETNLIKIRELGSVQLGDLSYLRSEKTVDPF